MDTLVIHPRESWIPEHAVDCADKMEEKVIEMWTSIGACPHPGDKDYYQRAGKGRFPDINSPGERMKMSGDWLSIKCGTPCLTIEVQNNNARTPPEEQLLYEEAAIHACVGMLID